MLALAEELQNISLACQRAGISRSHFYEIKEAFEKYGREGLAPQSRRRPRMPNQTPPETRAADPGDDRAIPHLQLPPHQPAASSDRRGRFAFGGALCVGPPRTDAALSAAAVAGTEDPESTRLNSSHGYHSYAR